MKKVSEVNEINKEASSLVTQILVVSNELITNVILRKVTSEPHNHDGKL